MIRDSTTTVFYCGCIDEVGHYVWYTETQKARYSSPLGFPTLWQAGRWDHATTRFTQTDDPHWTLVCVPDNTVDSRPGAHSTVIARGHHTREEMWGLLKVHFPNVHARLVAGGVIVDEVRVPK